ncbi:MAG: Asp-tRNA(Asn)/Glu-tRNA(Gln) amidotransferase subunit GatA [Chitinophagaceae bacterium]
MFSFSNITQYQSQLQNGSTTCKQTVEFYLSQIKKHQHLNAYVHVFENEALELANKIDAKILAKQPLGLLYGVVISIKDVLCYAQHKVSASSKILENFESVYTATAVQKLIDADAIIIGTNNCDEFAMGSSNENSAYGAVKNGLNETLVPGGSSGGSAVAVQMQTCMISLGSDTGGSVRQPADFCGIVGFKPTYGRISRYGLIAYASSFDQIGIFANNITDVALVLETIAGQDEFDSTVSPQTVPTYSKNLINNKTYKFAYFKQALEHQGLDKEIAKTQLEYIEKLKKLGHTVDAIDFELLDETIPTYYVLTTAEASSNLSRFDGVKFGFRAKGNIENLDELYKQTRTQGFGKEVQRRIMLGTFVLSAGYFDAYFTKAQQVRSLLVQTTKNIFENYDALISPTVPSTAFEIGNKSNDPVEMYLADIYTVFANLTGINGISIPLFKHSNGMPFGLQIMCDAWQDEKLLSISNQFLNQ